jgi:hypothetical protein
MFATSIIFLHPGNFGLPTAQVAIGNAQTIVLVTVISRLFSFDLGDLCLSRMIRFVILVSLNRFESLTVHDPSQEKHSCLIIAMFFGVCAIGKSPNRSFREEGRFSKPDYCDFNGSFSRSRIH